MKYFDILPKINYNFSTGNFTVPDIFVKVVFNDNFYSEPKFIEKQYQQIIKRPEQLSKQNYETFDNYWLYLMVNKVYDINKDWPLAQENFVNELTSLTKKSVYYIYENAEISPNDIIFYNENVYGIVESWNPFFRELVLKEKFGEFPSNPNGSTFSIKRIVKNSNGITEIINLTNFCSNQTFTCFGFRNYRNAISNIVYENKYLSPFTEVSSGIVSSSGELILNSCDTSQFQNSLIYKIINNENVAGVKVITKEDTLVKNYYNKLSLNFVNPEIVGALENKIKIMLNDSNETANTMIRIG